MTAYGSTQEFSTVIYWLSREEIKNWTVLLRTMFLLKPFRPLMVKPLAPEAQETADLINDLILKSQELLKRSSIEPETHGRR